MSLIMIHGIKFLDTSACIYVDFDGRNLKHPLVHVLGIFISKHVWESDCYFFNLLLLGMYSSVMTYLPGMCIL
jgi:hypothetical protein